MFVVPSCTCLNVASVLARQPTTQTCSDIVIKIFAVSAIKNNEVHMRKNVPYAKRHMLVTHLPWKLASDIQALHKCLMLKNL
jgi:hypothetical protein